MVLIVIAIVALVSLVAAIALGQYYRQGLRSGVERMNRSLAEVQLRQQELYAKTERVKIHALERRGALDRIADQLGEKQADLRQREGHLQQERAALERQRLRLQATRACARTAARLRALAERWSRQPAPAELLEELGRLAGALPEDAGIDRTLNQLIERLRTHGALPWSETHKQIEAMRAELLRLSPRRGSSWSARGRGGVGAVRLVQGQLELARWAVASRDQALLGHAVAALARLVDQHYVGARAEALSGRLEELDARIKSLGPEAIAAALDELAARTAACEAADAPEPPATPEPVPPKSSASR